MQQLKDQEEQSTGTVADAPAKGDKRVGLWVMIAGALVIVALAGTFITVSRMRTEERQALEQETKAQLAALPLVNVTPVKRSPANLPLTLPGETAAWYSTTIYSRVNGYLNAWNVDIGDRVKKGQVLATIDTPDLDSQLEAAKAEFNAAEAEAKVKAADADFARTSYERWRDSPKGVVSDQEREEKKAAYGSGIAQLNAANAHVNVARAKVDGLMSLTRYKTVSAPFDGVITQRRIDPGDLVTAGSTASTTPLFVLEQSDKIRVFTSVPQDVAGGLTVGAPVRVKTGEASERVYEGKIARTAGAVDPHARTMRVEADLPNPDYTLAPGMYVRTEIPIARPQSVEVPASALIFRSKEPQVAVVGNDGEVQFRNVSIASDNGDAIELSSGVHEGEHVALNINDQIANGQKVAINTSAGLTD